jgi:hypothetical protein
VTVSRHPAPTVRPALNATSCQWAKSAGWCKYTCCSHSVALGELTPKSFELLHGPTNEVLVDAPHQEAQLGAVEGSVIVDPAPHLRVDLLGEARQVRSTATVEVPGPDLLPYRLACLGAHGRGEATEIASWATSKAAPEGVAEEVEAGVLVVPSAVRVFAVSSPGRVPPPRRTSASSLPRTTSRGLSNQAASAPATSSVLHPVRFQQFPRPSLLSVRPTEPGPRPLTPVATDTEPWWFHG